MWELLLYQHYEKKWDPKLSLKNRFTRTLLMSVPTLIPDVILVHNFYYYFFFNHDFDTKQFF